MYWPVLGPRHQRETSDIGGLAVMMGHVRWAPEITSVTS